jgi:large subunit ribosomal protein L23
MWLRFKAILKQRGKKVISTKMLGQLSPYQIIVRPLLTEKSYKSAEWSKDSKGKTIANTYRFEVVDQSNKNDIKKSIESVYGVKVASVRTIITPDKGRANRSLVKKMIKKAVVRLVDGEKIEFVS